MQVKLMININQEERRSICNVILPNTELLNTATSILFPVSAFTAGTDVTIVTNITKRKLIFDLSAEGNKRMQMIPASGNKKAKKNGPDSVIGIGMLFIYCLVSSLFQILSSC
jgi:hypothetical protein